jgi:hypothetical protein
MIDSAIENSRFSNNSAENHSTKNWNIPTSFSANDVVFKNNIGLILEREFTFSASSGAAVANGLTVDADYAWVVPIETGVTDVTVSSLPGSDFIVNFSGGGTKSFCARVSSKLANLD